MIIDFDQIPQTATEHFKGGEKTFRANTYTDGSNRIMKGTLEPGASIGLHTHDTNSEIIFVISGSGKVLYNGEYERVSVGSCHYCPRGRAHSLINDGDVDLVFYAVIPEHE